MKALRLSTGQKDKSSLDAKCKEWLTRAEQIKAASDWQSAARTPERTPRSPASTRKLTTREEIILLEGGKLHGFKFPPWSNVPHSSEFERGEAPFTYVKVSLISPPVLTYMAEITRIFISQLYRERFLTAGNARLNYFRRTVTMQAGQQSRSCLYRGRQIWYKML